MLIDNELGVRVGGRSHAALVGGASQGPIRTVVDETRDLAGLAESEVLRLVESSWNLCDQLLLHLLGNLDGLAIRFVVNCVR